MKKIISKIKIIALFLFILIICLCFFNKYKFSITQDFKSIVKNTFSESNYKIIKLDNNSNYIGVGQKKVQNKDGYFTTFTTEEKNQKVYKEYKQNGNSSWSNKLYWDATMATDGCGITCMSIILSGYNKNYTPEYLREKYYPVLNGNNIPDELYKTFGISNSNFLYDSEHLSNRYIEKHLKSNRPILICVWNKPTNNRWTTASHYMVLLATDGNGMIYVSNPNGLENDSKSSGWYNIDEITPYIAKALFIEQI